MLIFGHLGIGKTLARPFSRGLPVVGILIGTVLPDIIDKSLYYSLCLLTGKHGFDLGLISGTRTIGHTGLFLIGLCLLAAITRSRFIVALALGDLTHLILDAVTTMSFEEGTFFESLSPVFWPWTGWAFPESAFDSLTAHLLAKFLPFIIISEAIGIAFLAWDYWRYRKSQ